MKFSPLLFVCLAFAPAVADACSCLPPGAPQKELEASDRVFLGTATSVEIRCERGTKLFVRLPGEGAEVVCATPAGEETGFPLKIARFFVSENFKGSGAEATIQTELYGAMCGVEFVAGEEYVVYAKRKDGVLSTSLCSRTGVATESETGLIDLRGGG